MRCVRCQEENPVGAKFCNACGARLEARCPACRHVNRAGSRFCNECGAEIAAATSAAPRFSSPASYTPRHLAEKILTSKAALEGERRNVTVLFADIADFTALAEQRDPEEVHQIIDRCFELVTAEIHRFEGTINQYTGDGVMALFGAPIAHEDAPRRAIHAALGIQRAMHDWGTELRRRIGRPLEMRIGINTGPVVIGKIGDDLRMDYTAVGDTTNLAARLQQTARPDTVVISAATHRLVAGYFETVDVGELSVKGRAPVQAFHVGRARARKGHLDVAAERGLTPLVGRDRELAVLVDLFDRARQGHGQVVCISGEAGIGKSRLVHELRRTLTGRGADLTWLEGRCISFGQSMPLLPIVDQLRENFGIEEVDGEPEIVAKVEHGMRRMGHLEAHIPFIRYLLSADPGDRAVTAMEASIRRKRIFEAVLALGVRGTTFRPIVFVVEDLHWIDTSTEEYLGLLVDSIANAAIMLLLTCRVGYSPAWGMRSFQTTLALDALSEPEMLAMAGRLLGVDRFPPELRTLLAHKAEGVPLFVEEVTKTLLDLGVLRGENGGYRVVKSLDEVSVPDTIQGIIMARLDRLGDNGKRTVQLASVIGRQFMRRLLERIAGLSGELEGLLRELKSLEIIYEQGLLPEPAYIFKHAVIQDVAYQSLLLQRRKELHRTVGYAIEELYSDRLPEHYAELAHHFAHGEEWGKALEYSLLAGDRAAATFANTEARKHYARALEMADRTEPRPEPGRLVQLHRRLAGVLNVLAEYDAAVSECHSALALLDDMGDRKEQAAALIELSNVYNWSHKLDLLLPTVNRALLIARDLGDAALQAGCLALRGEGVAVVYGPLVEALVDSGESLRLARETADPRLLAQALAFAGRHLEWHSDYDRAITYLTEGLDLARREHAGYLMGLALFHLGHARLARGEYEEALSLYRELADYAAAAGDKLYMMRAPNLLGGVFLDLYDLDEAIRLNAEGDEVSKRFWPWPEPRGHSLWKLGVAHLYRDDHGRAEAAFREATSLLDVDVWGRWLWEISLVRSLGELALSQGRDEEALDYASRSLELATRCRHRKHAARARALQGRILAGRDRLEDAVTAFRDSLDVAEGLGTLREGWMGQAALAQALGRLGRDREAEVALARAGTALDAIVSKLTMPGLRDRFLEAEPVHEVYRLIGRRPAAAGAPQPWRGEGSSTR
jgi:class 3 adenylate cyclase/tetratricopeptide (TPR) repeat protein